MKKVILLLAIVVSFSATKLFAQDNERMQQTQKAWVGYLKDSVKLSDALVDSVSAIRMQYQPQMRAMFMDQSASMQDKQTKMQGLRTQMETRYKSAGLTDGQVAAIRKHEDEMRAKMMERMNNGGGGN